jgi:predicted DsbA family dithiol-disulfide isomerase
MDWQPFELRPNAPDTGWPIPEHVRARMSLQDNPLRQRANQLGIQLVERDWVPSSRRAHECTEFARAHDKLEPFQAGVLRAYWSDGKDLHDWAVLAEIAAAVGLDATAMQDEVTAGAWREAVDERVSAAHELGIHAVPTFVVADRFMFQGAQTGDVFESVFRRAQSPSASR